MNALDVVAVLIVVFGLLGGIRSGALPQLGGLVGAVAGAGLVIALTPYVRTQLESLDPLVRVFVVLGSLILAVGLGEALGSGLGRWASLKLGRGVFSTVDGAAGGIVGIAQAALVVWLAGGLLAVGPFPSLAAQAQRSVAIRALNDILPPAPEVAADVGHLLDVSGLPEVFIGLEPFPAPPIDLPGSARARAIAAAAIASTVEVESAACGFGLAGTGFAVGPDYIVTNAHVVAGASHTSVVTAGGSTVDATIVLFDPELDVALLRAPGIRIPALRFAAATPSRGVTGAALGHPGGTAQLAVIPAAVTGSYPAEGRDLYGERIVTRDIIELRAAIQRGDSGGPLILPDGTVGGVVFAESRAGNDVGYALTPSEVAVRIMPAIGRTAAVDAGPCVR